MDFLLKVVSTLSEREFNLLIALVKKEESTIHLRKHKYLLELNELQAEDAIEVDNETVHKKIEHYDNLILDYVNLHNALIQIYSFKINLDNQNGREN